ncbi:translocation/assembly module TamB domain-containing protein [Sterolibacterium denitrificans]|nr:translocation/assembly module TamB domain-containing protein [Sterolibacterium denitrificans]
MPRLPLILCSALLCALLALAGGALWLVNSESGLQTTLNLLARYDGALHVEGARGRLLGPIDIARLRWQPGKGEGEDDLRLEIRHLHLDWSPRALLRTQRQRQLDIGQLRAERLTLHLPASDTPATLPDDLQLPLPVQIRQLALGELYLDERLLAQKLAARLSSDGQRHRLDALDFVRGAIGVKLSEAIQLDARPPFALQGKARIEGQLEMDAVDALDAQPHSFTLDIQASGTLERIALDIAANTIATTADTTAALNGQGSILLTPFAALPFASAQLRFGQLNPADWQADAPNARLDLSLDLAPQDAAIVGSFKLANQQPGPLDRQRLPLSSLSGKLHWQADQAQLTELHARLPGAGELTGRADWQGATQTLHLDLAARQLDASKIAGMLRPSRLAGSLGAELGRDRQSLRLDLRDRRMQLLADASLAERQLSIRQLRLQAGAAALQLHGELGLAAPRRFRLDGELRQFDPAQFMQLAQLPAAHLNARLQASGQLLPKPQVSAQFTLRDSQLARQPLAGHGALALAWPVISKADIALTAGNNHLRVLGNYGTADGRLSIDLDAPQLAAYGLEGGLTAQGELRGSLQQPRLNLQLDGKRLAWPEKFQLTGLNLQMDVGSRDDAPLDVKLALERLDLPGRAALLRQLQLQSSGRLAAHRLQASGNLAGGNRLQLLAEGGWSTSRQSWQGKLQEATLRSRERTRNFRLQQPAVLSVGMNERNWQIGPLTLAGDPLDWRATLQAASTGKQLQASLQAEGSRLGQLDASLQAAMLDPWSLDRTARWQGRLRSDISDLGWLAELIGEDWQSAGRLHGELQLGGTPQHPSGSGRLRGERLALQLPEQGLQLTDGELTAELQDDLLRIRRLAFDSPLQPAPRALLRSAPNEKTAIEALGARPGRLEISGEIPLASLDPDGARGQETSWLEVRLDRLGAWQRSDQWLLLSGDGRLSWQAGTLGARGQLRVDAGYWQLARGGTPRLSDDVTIVRTGAPAADPPFRPRLDLDVEANLGRRFHFNGAGLGSRLTGTLRVNAEGRDMPRASGSIRTQDGRFEAYGQTLELERGILRFDGLLDNPGLDIRAVRKGLSVEPGVQVSGTVQKPRVRLVSDPELPDTEKLAWLVLGHGAEQMGVGDATTLLAAAGDLLGNDAGNVMQQIRKSFGVDEIGIRQGSLDGQRQTTSRIAGNGSTSAAATDQQIFTVGKRLSSNTLLSYEQILGKAESIVKLTVNLSRRIALIGRAGSDNALDIFYTMSFGQPPKPKQEPKSAPARAPDAR